MLTSIPKMYLCVLEVFCTQCRANIFAQRLLYLMEEG